MPEAGTAAIILFGHGARDPDWARPMQNLAAALAHRAPDVSVRLAFLEFMAPNLPEAVDAAVAAGAQALRIVPVFLAQGGHVRREVPEMLAAIQARHPGVVISLEAALGENPAVIAAMASVILPASSTSSA